MPFMCITCDERPVFNASEAAVDHMTRNPFHQMVYYDDKSIDSALEKVKMQISEDAI
ncbi:MAG: hypothetical protein ACE5KA_02725 [Nitrososphaerales archaeon]